MENLGRRKSTNEIGNVTIQINKKTSNANATPDGGTPMHGMSNAGVPGTSAVMSGLPLSIG